MKWVLAESDERAAAALADQGGIHPLIARLLVNRGVTALSAARDFLECDLSLLSAPSVFSGMEAASGRIAEAVERCEKIVVYGDYDVDGVTGAVLLYHVLNRIGASVDYYIPHRISEGYGINTGALERIRKSGADLVVTVDCGIGAVREVEYAHSLGLDIIITDHHEMGGSSGVTDLILPDAAAVLHPGLLLPDVSASVRERVRSLTGVGVAFKLAQALLKADGCDDFFRSCLDLVALGTVADVGRITGENRVLVRHGLARLSLSEGTLRPGIAALKRVAGLNGKKVGVGTVGFTLAPRINASGRLERADAAFRLLTAELPQEAEILAAQLDEVNRQRQAVEETIREDARRLCGMQDRSTTGAFVLSSPGWHPGIIGIVASRIVEEFYRPTALISVKDGIGKGSARSIPGFDLYGGLERCKDLLLGYGGHRYAAGFTISENRIPEFRERLGSAVLETVGNDGFRRTQVVDAAVSLEELTIGLLRQIDMLSPFGQGNPEPRLGARGLRAISPRIVGNNHLKLRLGNRNGTAFDAIAFNRGDLLGRRVHDGARLAVVFTPRLNSWKGNTAVELEIKDLKLEKESSNLK